VLVLFSVLTEECLESEGRMMGDEGTEADAMLGEREREAGRDGEAFKFKFFVNEEGFEAMGGLSGSFGGRFIFLVAYCHSILSTAAGLARAEEAETSS